MKVISRNWNTTQSPLYVGLTEALAIGRVLITDGTYRPTKVTFTSRTTRGDVVTTRLHGRKELRDRDAMEVGFMLGGEAHINRYTVEPPQNEDTSMFRTLL